MLSHCKNNAFQYKIKDICIPSSSRGVLDLALARSPENYQKRAPGFKNDLTYLHIPPHMTIHMTPRRSKRIWKNIFAKLPLDDELLEAAPTLTNSGPKMCASAAACCALDNVVLEASCLAIRVRSSTFCRIRYLILVGFRSHVSLCRPSASDRLHRQAFANLFFKLSGAGFCLLQYS